MRLDTDKRPICPVTIAIDYEPETGDPLPFLKTLLQKQQEAAYEEIGDDLRSGPELVSEVSILSGTSLPEQKANMIHNAANECLARRFMGACSIDLCKKGELMDELLVEIEQRPVAINMKEE